MTIYFLSIEIDRNIEGITGSYNSSTSATSDRPFSEFPTMYVERLEGLLWPKWYTACFTTSYHNSSLWGHYADGHKGVCLIFRAAETERPDRKVHFHVANYVDRLPEVDFFRSIGAAGTVPLNLVRKLWYTDENGTISECAPQGHENAWKQTLWERFIRPVTTKTKDWQYENECRTIAIDCENDPIRSYNFGLLKGIIFGTRTSDEDKRAIIEIVKRKCEEHNRTDFQLLQAYYSHGDGDIRAEKIQL